MIIHQTYTTNITRSVTRFVKYLNKVRKMVISTSIKNIVGTLHGNNYKDVS